MMHAETAPSATEPRLDSRLIERVESEPMRPAIALATAHPCHLKPVGRICIPNTESAGSRYLRVECMECEAARPMAPPPVVTVDKLEPVRVIRIPDFILCGVRDRGIVRIELV